MLKFSSEPSMIMDLPPRSTQLGHPSVVRRNEYQQKPGRKQANRAMQ